MSLLVKTGHLRSIFILGSNADHRARIPIASDRERLASLKFLSLMRDTLREKHCVRSSLSILYAVKKQRTESSILPSIR
jgi:hypothetical protein